MSYYSASAGIQIATQDSPTVFYELTDHNRSAISIAYETIEKVGRMADGTMRKYVVAKKKKVNTGWNNIPSGTGTPTLPTVLRKNLILNPNFEASTNYWGTNLSTLSITSTYAYGSGLSSLRIAGSSPSAFGTSVSTNPNGSSNNKTIITASQNYYFSVYARNFNFEDMPMKVGIRWYTNTGTLISRDVGTPISGSYDWVRLSASAISPSNAVYAIPYVSTDTVTSPSGSTITMAAFGASGVAATNYSIKMGTDTSGTKFAATSLGLVNGQAYTFSAWIYPISASSVQASVESSSLIYTSGTASAGVLRVLSPNKWQRVSASFIANSASFYNFIISDPGTYTFDSTGLLYSLSIDGVLLQGGSSISPSATNLLEPYDTSFTSQGSEQSSSYWVTTPFSAGSSSATTGITWSNPPAPVFLIDQALFEQSSTLNSYFDGYSLPVLSTTTSYTTWSDGANKSISNLISTADSSKYNGGYTMTVDGAKGGAWMKSFYEDNLFKPVKVRVIHSDDDWTKNSPLAFYSTVKNPNVEEFWAFITKFDYMVSKRYSLTDMVDVSIEFTEI